MKQASKKLLASLLSVMLMLSCVIIPGAFSAYAATDVEEAFAASLGVQIGETYIDADYSAAGATANGWSSGSIGTGANVAVTGLKLRNTGGQQESFYTAPNDDFVAKMTVYNTKTNSFGIKIGTYSEATTKTTYARVTNTNSYATNNQLRFYYDEQSTSSAVVTLGDTYDLDNINKPITLYVFSYDGTVYFVDCNGTKLFEYEVDADKIFLSCDWSEVVLTEFSVRELYTPDIEEIFASSISASVGETYIDTDYSADGAAVDGWDSGSIGTGANVAVTGLKLRNTGGQQESFYTAPNDDFVAKMTVYNTKTNSFGIKIGTYSETTTKTTYARVTNSNSYATNNQLRFYYDEQSTANDVVTLGDTYDLDDINKPITLYVFSYDGTVYFVDCNGTKLFEYEVDADKIFLSCDWSEVVLTEFSVRELCDPNRLVWTKEPSVALDFETTYTNADGDTYYSRNANCSIDNNRGSHSAIITEDDGNKAMRLTYDTQSSNENYNANAAFNLFEASTQSKFVGTAGKKYRISFQYKIEATDDKELQLYIPNCGRTSMYATDLGPKAMQESEANFASAYVTDILTETTDEYITVTYTFNANGSDHPIILLQTNGKTKDSTHTGNRAYASVLIDNVEVVELPDENSSEDELIYTLIPVKSLYGDEGRIGIYKTTTFAELKAPTRQGFVFDGWYTDEYLSNPASNSDLVGNYKVIYIKWAGDGSAVTPDDINSYFTVSSFKIFNACSVSDTLESLTYVQNSLIEPYGTASVTDFYGSYVFSGDSVSKNSGKEFILDNINVTSPAANTVILYVELPDFSKSGDSWALGLGDRGLCINQNSKWIWTDLASENKFSYAQNGEWVQSTIGADGAFTGLPSGYKGYIKIDFEELSFETTVDFDSSYKLSCVEFIFNAVGGENGDAVLGGVFYFPETKPAITVMNVGTLYYQLAKSSQYMTLSPYDVKTESGSFSTRYSGTAGVPAVEFVNTETSAFWGDAPAGITTASGEAETTVGYMTTYKNISTLITMQPGVDTLVFYVEMPKFEKSSTMAGLKMLDLTLRQGETVTTLNFSNSLYKYASVYDVSWKLARGGADGELYDIPSGFKGYIKFDLKQFKNILNITDIDFSNTYYVTSFELGFNHIGGENGKLVIGGMYSALEDSNSPFIKHNISGKTLCYKVLQGDFNCDGDFSNQEVLDIRQSLMGKASEQELNAAQELRADNMDITSLVKAVLINHDTVKVSANVDNGISNEEIFTPDYTTDKAPTIYEDYLMTDADVAGYIQADTAWNNTERAKAFASAITTNRLGSFEKSGIDKMVHVSTFICLNNNIYMTYYANTMSASENPKYQVARLAYAPENNLNNKVILDIMQVGDNLYGYEVTGVYDTILMHKNDEPNNLYILWTAQINGKYYRLYRIFNMQTGELGEIGVNKFKVKDTVNDFSTSGMTNALTLNDIGYRRFFTDIGIMQKLSTRVENGETYYYTGAYCGSFTCIIKSKDLITWEYVAQPNEGANGTGFMNCTKWENATYVIGDKVYYFVRQWDPSGVTNGIAKGSLYGILTSYDLITGEWAKPVLVGDCQSRSDFIEYDGDGDGVKELYLFYAPTDRRHIGILKINKDNLAESEVVLQANMNHSCFYPFIQYGSDGELRMSYTRDRLNIYLTTFNLRELLKLDNTYPTATE